MSLYADDLLCFISRPAISIPALLDLLNNFSQFSGYKLNLNKSELFVIGEGSPAVGYSNFPFKIVENKFTYLGIAVTKKHMHLFKENFLTLLNHTRRCLSQWSPLSTSLAGRINSIKMNILPKFLYTFQSVPTFIPKSFFDSLDSIISSYIWKGKRPRLHKMHLQKSKKDGGMALPNFRFYYWAANIRCLTFWSHFHSRPDRPLWVSMEVGSTQNISISALLGSSLPFPSTTPIYNPVVRHTLRVWAQFRRHFGLLAFCLSSPIIANHLFQPSLLDSKFQEWQRLGICRFKDLFIDNMFLPFEHLSRNFKIPNSHFFRYLQIRDFLRCQIPNFPVGPDSNIADSLLCLHPSHKGLISVIYSKLLGVRQAPLIKIKTAWEQDLNLSIPEDTWETVFKLINDTSLYKSKMLSNCLILWCIEAFVVHGETLKMAIPSRPHR